MRFLASLPRNYIACTIGFALFALTFLAYWAFFLHGLLTASSLLNPDQSLSKDGIVVVRSSLYGLFLLALMIVALFHSPNASPPWFAHRDRRRAAAYEGAVRSAIATHLGAQQARESFSIVVMRESAYWAIPNLYKPARFYTVTDGENHPNIDAAAFGTQHQTFKHGYTSVHNFSAESHHKTLQRLVGTEQTTRSTSFLLFAASA